MQHTCENYYGLPSKSDMGDLEKLSRRERMKDYSKQGSLFLLTFLPYKNDY
jgi:hypothetical protein